MNRIGRLGIGAAGWMLLVQSPALAAEEGDEVPFLLQWGLGEFLWTLALFLLLLGVLIKWVWPPILKGLQDRETKIARDLTEAQQANQEAKQTLEQYKQQLAEARKEAQQIMDQSRTEADRQAARIKEEAQQELSQMRQRAEAEITAAKEQAIAEVYEQTATLATQVAGQILQREISPDDQRALVEQALSKLEQTEKV